ncbi:serine hydrolase domain-containing protein [Pseudonocardia asaccharolytica]|uniref:D-Ala-D-Ala carboxypeptidase n=1 Tax=Pseudonocardia asaccharolytica DSM 44247 = NBRC 16224 TaxID=1123024 RepID=A0A511CUD8_9PSEU|nr:serine hydrolase domain-containing protein [Pseudonocardia asaccharolytica]GEL16200.1 D-Ala-D-Ala carboxypeptidase [Pseudonocardia asaccharolytica DSM 44247 = NBRC 16224]
MKQAEEELGPELSGRAGVSRRAVLVGAAAWGVGALVSACSGSPSTPPGAAPVDPAPLPESPALRAQFEQTAKELMTPGAVMIVRTPDGELSATYGSRTDTGSEPVSVADHVRIGSITKTFTGTVILQLAQEGKLDIDAPVAEYRPDVPNGKNITLTQLLNMRSGLYNYSESLEFNQSLDDDPAKVWTPEELVALGFKYPAYFSPGTDYHYSNTNIVLLGLIIEQVDKQPLGSAYRTRLFTPLALHETSFPDAAVTAIPTPHPRGYMYGTNVSTMSSEALPPDQLAAAQAGTIRPHDVTDASPSWTWAAGGAISTAADLATWGRALSDGTLLNPMWQRKRLESVQPTNPGSPAAPGYGLAIAKFGPVYGHTGELPGFQSFTAYDPDRKVTVVVWANLNAAPDGRPPASTIAQKLIGTLYG